MDRKIKRIIEIIDNKLKKFSDVSDGHTKDHFRRVLHNALKIQEVEGGDVVVVAIAAYLHDMHRWLADGQQYMDPKDSLEVIDDIIAELDVSYLQREKILLAIEHHEEYDFGSNKVSVQDIEAKIIQDADNLDAIGAIGIGRAFAYSAIHKMPDYICDVELYRNEYTEGVNDVSTIHHVFNKLLRIEKHLNTQEAKRLARGKTEFMKIFMQQYIKEWEAASDK